MRQLFSFSLWSSSLLEWPFGGKPICENTVRRQKNVSEGLFTYHSGSKNVLYGPLRVSESSFQEI